MLVNFLAGLVHPKSVGGDAKHRADDCRVRNDLSAACSHGEGTGGGGPEVVSVYPPILFPTKKCCSSYLSPGGVAVKMSCSWRLWIQPELLYYTSRSHILPKFDSDFYLPWEGELVNIVLWLCNNANGDGWMDSCRRVEPKVKSGRLVSMSWRPPGTARLARRGSKWTLASALPYMIALWILS